MGERMSRVSCVSSVGVNLYVHVCMVSLEQEWEMRVKKSRIEGV